MRSPLPPSDPSMRDGKPLWRRVLHRGIPAHLQDPLGLAKRLLKTGDPAAMFAMQTAALALCCWPLDMTLRLSEQRRMRASSPTHHPVILICGPPRSGTTLVYQTLVQSLRSAHFPNLTSLFPSSPLTAVHLFGRFLSSPESGAHSFYGRTSGLGGTNDALYLWDRWLGRDRNQPPNSLSPATLQAMRSFFCAASSLFDLPIINKNNSLNVSAHLVAETLQPSLFLCLQRCPQELAESLYRARCDIHGNAQVPYGLTPPAASQPVSSAAGHQARVDPVASVCDQVAYFVSQAEAQQRRLGKDRFWLVDYHDFCRNPSQLAVRVASEFLCDAAYLRSPLPQPIAPSHRERVAPAIAERIREELKVRCLTTYRESQLP